MAVDVAKYNSVREKIRRRVWKEGYSASCKCRYCDEIRAWGHEQLATVNAPNDDDDLRGPNYASRSTTRSTV